MADSPRPPDAAGVGPSEPVDSAPVTPGEDAPESPTAAPIPTAAPAAGPSWSAAAAPATTVPETAVPPFVPAAIPAQPMPPAVAAAEAAARAAAAQMAVRGRAWWGQLDPTGKKPTLIVAAVLIALVIGSQFINALVPVSRGASDGGGGGGAPTGAPIDIGNGIRVTPPAGWVPVGAPLGLPGVRFQRGAITVEVGIAAFTATPRGLVLAYVNQVFAPAAQDVKLSDVRTGVAGNGRPTARATYAASFKDFGTAVEGEISAQVSPTGIGIIVNGYGPQGQLAGSLDDVHAFVDTIEVGQ